MFKKLYDYRFLFWELIKRDFKKKYKRTVLGVLWSMLSPLMLVLAQSIVFTHIFGRSMPHFIIYMFCGNLFFSYFRESTNSGMLAFEANAGIITKIQVPKYLFLFSKNISSFINLILTFVILLIFCIIDQVAFTFKFFLVPYPILCLLIFNIGVGLIISCLFVFFRDTQYLYDVFCTILMYFSAIFYTTEAYPEHIAYLFYLNPIYAYISYLRKIIIFGEVPSVQLHLLCMFYALVSLLIGVLVYRKNNRKFLYYL